ncbi:MAG: PhnD/SsuA/transferrin family substrate-binding protein, partial [Campylobacterales bacterium]|nr:PhnD/SsuA/transferrin family substrate-binding protein [Campylobacterales bacterium]
MKFLFKFIVITSFFQLLIAKELIYVPLPINHEESVIEDNKIFIDYVSKVINKPIKIKYIKKYDDIIKEFKENKIDLIQIGPLPYVTLKSEFSQIEPILFFKEKGGIDKYTCAIVSTFDGPTKVEEINSKIALTQPLSTCGYFLASYLLKNKNIDIDAIGYDYLGSHDDVIEHIILDRYKSGSVKTSVAEKYSNMSIKIVAESELLPSFVLAVNPSAIT